MTKQQTYAFAVRALKRLRTKELIYGRRFGNAEGRTHNPKTLTHCCATGAMYAAFDSRKAMANFNHYPLPFGTDFDPSAWGAILDANDSYLPANNKASARRLRYKYVLALCEARAK